MSDPVLDACRQWIELALPELKAVVYRYQPEASAPRPELPYAAIWLESDDGQTWAPNEVTTDTSDSIEPEKVVQKREQKRRATLVVDLFGPDSMVLARRLRPSICWPEVRSLLESVDDGQGHLLDLVISVQRPATDTTTLRDTTWEPSCQVDFSVKFIHHDEKAVPWVETVNQNYTFLTQE